MAIDTNGSEFQVDSRDYLSIFSDLMDAVSNMSQTWNTTDENDAGVVLIKLISMYGDMISYNHDKSVLEVYPASVTQRRNAVQVFGLLGYKLHWYQSARCTAYLVNTGVADAYLPRYTTFVTQNGDITYTYIGEQKTLLANSNSPVVVELIQGVPRIPSYVGSEVIPSNFNYSWSSVFNFNVSSEDIVANNKIYLEDVTVDETSIVLIDDSDNEWTQVENIDALTYTGRYFELKIDNDDKPYIELVSYWKNLGASQFKLFYVVSAGINGQIMENKLKKASSKIVKVENGTQVDVAEYINVSNSVSTYGYDFETADEARDNSVNYINTYDTLVTTSDFEKATRRIEGVANCIVTDMTNDPNPSDFDGQGNAFKANDVKIYVTRTDAYEQNVPAETFKSTILNDLKKNKLMPLNLRVDFDSIGYYNWTIKGTIYLKEKVNTITASNILDSVSNAISVAYDKSNIQYNSIIGYSGLIDTIRSASPLIYNIDVDGIEYFQNTYDQDNNITGRIIISDKSIITGRYNSKVDVTGVTTYTATLNSPIKPSSLTITFDSGRATIFDDKAGELLCSSALFQSGTVDYETGEIEINFVTAQTTTLNITYQKNVINMVLPQVDIETELVIAEESIKV